MTPETLLAAVGCTPDRASLYAPLLSDACARYDIKTLPRLAAFLAQISHESGALRWTREIWGPTPVQSRYEGRDDLGNNEPGDGARYLGRGLVQTTGRRNYRHLTRRLKVRLGEDAPDFEANPELLERPQWAAMSAADYWDMRGLNALADAGKIIEIGRAINRGNPNSTQPANGEADRLARWTRARKALSVPLITTSAEPAPEAPTTIKEQTMPIPAILAALLPSLIEAIPKLGKLFGSGSEVSERNVAAVTMAMDIAKEAVGATNAQEAVEMIKADPVALQTATKAIEARWLDLSFDGVDSARKTEVDNAAAGYRFWYSPSFWVTVLLLPLVYIIVGSLVGLWGTATWSDEVRASIATAIISLVIGGAAGYFWGATTSRNRIPAP